MSHLQNCSVKLFKEHWRYFTKNGGGGSRGGGMLTGEMSTNNNLRFKKQILHN